MSMEYIPTGKEKKKADTASERIKEQSLEMARNLMEEFHSIITSMYVTPETLYHGMNSEGVAKKVSALVSQYTHILSEAEGLIDQVAKVIDLEEIEHYHNVRNLLRRTKHELSKIPDIDKEFYENWLLYKETRPELSEKMDRWEFLATLDDIKRKEGLFESKGEGIEEDLDQQKITASNSVKSLKLQANLLYEQFPQLLQSLKEEEWRYI